MTWIPNIPKPKKRVKEVLVSYMPIDIIQEKSGFYKVDPLLIQAIIKTESGGNKFASRWEPQYPYIYKPEKFAEPLGITLQTEIALQKFSYGLMQCMGAVFRELGYTYPLPMAFEYEVNLEYGIRHFKSFLERHSDTDEAIASYNAGSPRYGKDGKLVNQHYVDKVNAEWARLRSSPRIVS